MTYYALSPPTQVVNTRTISGLAVLTSLTRLPPYQKTGEDRITDNLVGLSENMRLDLCINPDSTSERGELHE